MEALIAIGETCQRGFDCSNRVGNKILKVFEKKEYNLKLCLKILLNCSEYISQRKSTFEEEEKTILSCLHISLQKLTFITCAEGLIDQQES